MRPFDFTDIVNDSIIYTNIIDQCASYLALQGLIDSITIVLFFLGQSTSDVIVIFALLNTNSFFADFIFNSHYKCSLDVGSKLIGANMAFRSSVFESSGGFYTVTRKRGDETLFFQEYISNNGTYYYTSSGCSSNTTQQIIANLFDGSKNLSEKDFYYCISGNSNANTYTLTAKMMTNNCEIYRDEKNIISFSNC